MDLSEINDIPPNPVLEAKLVAAVDRAVNGGPPAEVVIAAKLASLAGLGCGGCQDDEKSRRLAAFYATWAKEIAKALREAGLLAS